MNWSKSKTIFILLFILIDLSLLGYLVYSKVADQWISQSTIEELCTYLEKRQIHVESGTIPQWTPKVRNLELINILDIENTFLKQFETESSELDHIGNELELRNGQKSIVISENYFHYQDLIEPGYFDSSSGSAWKKLKPYLTELGFDLQNAAVEMLEEGMQQVAYRIVQAAEGMTIDDISIRVTLTAAGELDIQGIWLNPLDTESGYRKVLVHPVTSALIEFSRETDQQTTIADISIHYRVDETKTYHKSFTAVAVWRITASDGTQYYYNAWI